MPESSDEDLVTKEEPAAPAEEKAPADEFGFGDSGKDEFGF